MSISNSLIASSGSLIKAESWNAILASLTMGPLALDNRQSIADQPGPVKLSISLEEDHTKIGNTSNHGLSILTNHREQIKITAGGNVGIGSSFPEAKLSVNGEFIIRKFDGGQLHSTRADSDFDIIQSNESTKRTFSIHGGQKGGNIFDVYAMNNGKYTHGLTVANKTGNVGIGTPTPETKFVVLGDFRLQRKEGGFFHSTRSDSDFDFVQDHNSRSRTLSVHGGKNGRNVFDVYAWNHNNHVHGLSVKNISGNVGIGTSDPNHKLEVIGQTFVSGAVRCERIESHPHGHRGAMLRTRNTNNNISFTWDGRRLGVFIDNTFYRHI